MTTKELYWPIDRHPWREFGYELSAAGRIALSLVSNHVTQVAAEPAGEDSAGRQKMRLQVPETIVARAFAIAEEFVRVAEDRGYMRPAIQGSLDSTMTRVFKNPNPAEAV